MDRFDDFWIAYPRKIAKAAARKAWSKLRLHDDPDEILAAIQAQIDAKDAAKRRGAWVPEWPYPASWLNGRRWEDEIEVQASTSTASDGWQPWCRHERKCGSREYHEMLLARGVKEMEDVA